MVKKTLAVLLCVTVLLIPFYPACAAKTEGEFEGIVWSFRKGVLSFSGNGIPRSYNTPWEQYNRKVSELIIGEGIVCLDYSDVFSQMTRLQKIVFEHDRFDDWFPEAESIREIVYKGTNPVFNGRSFVSSRLDRIVFENSTDRYIQEGRFLFNKDKTELVYYLGSATEEVNVPEGVRIIGEGAFANSNTSSVILPSSLEEIRDCAFEGSAVQSVVIPASCRTIGPEAFCMCRFLADVRFLGDETELIDHYVYQQQTIKNAALTFAMCTSLREISIPKCTNIPECCFLGDTALEKIVIGDGTGSIDSFQVFSGCNKLESIYIPDGTEFESTLFDGGNPPVIICRAGSDTEEKAAGFGWGISNSD